MTAGLLAGTGAGARQGPALTPFWATCTPSAAIAHAFAPDPAELEQARQTISSYEAALSRGRGAAALDSRMIDLATVRRARLLLDAAARASRPPVD